MRKIISVVIAIVLVLSCTGALSACSKKDDGTFTYLLSAGADETYISSYAENPSVKYLLSKEYNGKKLDIDFNTMVAGSEKEQFQTMISTGEYYDILDMSYSGYSIGTLYEMGIAMDLTELVNEYMPNYKAYIDSHEEVRMRAYTIVDGEKKILQIVGCNDATKNTFEGYMYRRDWIVKYGVNPKTGEPFTGGYGTPKDGNTWTDNVVFPSWYDENNKYAVEYKANHPEWDGTDPVFISDWEWMFEIFEKAFKDLGVTDGYCMSIYYVGVMGAGDFYSGFGGGAPLFSRNSDGEVTFNLTNENTKAYLECMRSWYEKGWLDKRFSERSSDMFFKINQEGFYQGKVPMMCIGVGSSVSAIDDDNYPLTKGAMMLGARMPINDLYGEDSTKGHAPDTLYQFSSYSGAVAITTAAEGKDLATLLTFMDSLYTEEGAIIGTLGLNAEQYNEIKDSLEKDSNGKDVVERYSLTDGMYYVKDGSYYKAKAIQDGGYLLQAVVPNRIGIGLKKISGVVEYEDKMIQRTQKEWMTYKNTAGILDYDDLLNEEQSKAYNKVSNQLNDKVSVELPKFIKGTYNMTTDFETFAKTVNKMGPEKVTKIFQELFNGMK